LASAAPRSPYRHLELCGIALSVGKAERSKKNGLFLQRGGLFEFPVSPKWMYNRKESL
jgi:hypothetical protein